MLPCLTCETSSTGILPLPWQRAALHLLPVYPRKRAYATRNARNDARNDAHNNARIGARGWIGRLAKRCAIMGTAPWERASSLTVTRPAAAACLALYKGSHTIGSHTMASSSPVSFGDLL